MWSVIFWMAFIWIAFWLLIGTMRAAFAVVDIIVCTAFSCELPPSIAKAQAPSSPVPFAFDGLVLICLFIAAILTMDIVWWLALFGFLALDVLLRVVKE